MEFPTLHLTYSVKEAATPGVYIGRINEIGGIYAQADSPEQVRADLIRVSYTMLRQYKQREVMDLLVKQQQARLEDLYASPAPDFRLELQEQKLIKQEQVAEFA